MHLYVVVKRNGRIISQQRLALIRLRLLNELQRKMRVTRIEAVFDRYLTTAERNRLKAIVQS